MNADNHHQVQQLVGQPPRLPVIFFVKKNGGRGGPPHQSMEKSSFIGSKNP
jgi:hypothetical protein